MFKGPTVGVEGVDKEVREKGITGYKLSDWRNVKNGEFLIRKGDK